MDYKFRNKKGITLIALVVTIIILLILAGMVLATLTGKQGILKRVFEAKQKSEIAREKEAIALAVSAEMVENQSGLITQAGMQRELDASEGEGNTKVNVDNPEKLVNVKFISSGRIYEVDKTGNIVYLGEEKTLLEHVNIVPNPSQNTTPELVQKVELEITIPILVEDENIELKYAWNQSKTEAPESNEYLESSFTGSPKSKKANLSSTHTIEGDYYLWVKLKVEEKELTETYGPYKIKDHTTLLSCASEGVTDSGFLGNTEIKRNEIESVRIATSFEGHSLSDSNCWDVSQSQDGKYIAWYEDKDSNNYYEVTVAGNGGVVANSNSANLFQSIGYNGEDTQVIYGIENLDTGLVTNMSSMFYRCRNMNNLDVSNFNTENVTNMGYLFNGCRKLISLDVSSFNTDNVTNMTYMFYGCSNLTSLDASNFNTVNTTNTEQMFSGCSNLSSLDVSKFNTDNVTNMVNMFNGCSNLSSLDVSNFNTDNVTNMRGMFQGCSNLSSLDVSNFNTGNVTDMTSMFYTCSNLTSLDVSKFNTKNVTNMWDMFFGCSNLSSLDLSDFNTENVTNMAGMFQNCRNVTNLDISKFNTENVTNMTYMFYGCSKLSSLDVSNFNTENVTNMAHMFNRCSNLSSLDVSNFNTENVTNMAGMFNGCSKLETLDISNFVIKEETIYDDIISGVSTTVTIKTNNAVANLLKEKFPSYASNIIS